MTRREVATDAVIAVLAAGASMAILAAGGLGDGTGASRPTDLLGVVLVLAATLPLAARRLAPLRVYAVVSTAYLVIWALDYRADIPIGVLLAVFTLGLAYGGAPRPQRFGAMLAVAALVPGAGAVFAWQGFDLAEVVVPELATWALLLVGLWITGDRVRLRRERMAELTERARRIARDAERERRVTTAEERVRIARELHDSAGHAINVILVQAGAARLLHERDPAASRRAIATIEEVARDTISEIDRLVRALREGEGEPSEWPAPADPEAIDELVERHRASGLHVTTEVRGEPPSLPRSVAWAAYRILQEALTNAARHGEGSARVVVRFGTDAVDLAVTNPARAPAADDAAPAAGGHGIIGMRERATLLGGSLQTAHRDGTFQLSARLPYPEGAAR